jgi:hypothetical protein
MSLIINNQLKKIDEWVESDEGKTYFEKERKKLIIKGERYLRFEKWLENNDFDILINKLISEHNNEYREKCYNNGFEPYPNNKLAFIIDYVVDNYESIIVTQINSVFPNQIWCFKEYYFQMIWGQGVLTNIYKIKDLKLLLQI